MPYTSARQELLNDLNPIALHVMQARDQSALLYMRSDIDDSDLDTDNNQNEDVLKLIFILPPSLISPLIVLDILDFESKSDSDSDHMDD